jgi:hypothetical protein
MIWRVSLRGGNLQHIDRRNTLDDRNLTATVTDRFGRRSEFLSNRD